jgi:hypothetical protein
MSLAEAKDRIARAGILALIYTSPSYAPDAPKFRVVCPTSKELPPEDRAHLVDRLNGIMGGTLAIESWTLSQAFYYGAAADNPHHTHHEATVFPGTPIDLADQLDASAIGRPKERNIGERPHPTTKPEDITNKRINAYVTALLDNVRRAEDGQKHTTLRDNGLTMGGILYLTGWSVETAVEMLVGALPSADDWDKARSTATWAVERGQERPIELEDRPNPNQGRRRSPPPPPPSPGNPAGHPSGPEPEPPPPPEDWDRREPPPKDEDDTFVLPVAYSENQLAYTFTSRHADTLRYVHDWGEWLRWEAGLWRDDHAVTVYDAARVICAEHGETAILFERSAGKKIAAAINKASCVAAIERLARHHHRHVLPTDAFDADTTTLNSPDDRHVLPGKKP